MAQWPLLQLFSQLIIGWDKILQSDICYSQTLGSGVLGGRSEFCSKSSACPGGPCTNRSRPLGDQGVRQVSGKRRKEFKAHNCHSTVKLCLGCRGASWCGSGAGVAAGTCLTRCWATMDQVLPIAWPHVETKGPPSSFPLVTVSSFLSGFLNTWFGLY